MVRSDEKIDTGRFEGLEIRVVYDIIDSFIDGHTRIGIMALNYFPFTNVEENSDDSNLKLLEAIEHNPDLVPKIIKAISEYISHLGRRCYPGDLRGEHSERIKNYVLSRLQV